MASFRLVRTVSWYYFRNYYRSKSFYLMLSVVILVSALMTYFTFRYENNLSTILPRADMASFSPGLKEDVFGYLWAFVLLDLPVFAAVFFGSPAISSEIESRTAYQIFPLPVGRSKLLLSKYLAAVAVTSLCILIYVLVQASVFLYLFHSLGISFFQSSALLVLFIFTVTAFTFMISGIFNRNTYAYITVFLIYFLVFNAYEIIVEFLYRTTPYYLLNVSADIIDRVYFNIIPDPFSTSFTLSPAGTSVILQSVGVMVSYLIVSLSAALIIFERKEVK
ncbi:MAG: ABC transporter permease [Thermoplasmata archaeon]|uniref:ABC transporter permease n=1 Tax=Candidatus Sysuiplasma superficiale TaxID=2823368 RepID=A0A8J7YX54_9ARCH|nr:ABC transporter permease [Candidatus Sysuiplasma superficiale]